MGQDNYNNTNRINKIIQWAVTAGGISAAATLAIKALGELRELRRNNEIAEKFEEAASPKTKIRLRTPMLERQFVDSKTKEELAEDLNKVASENEAIGGISSEALKWIAAIVAGGAGIYASNKLFNKVKEKSLETELEDSKAQYYSALFTNKKLNDELRNKKLRGAGMYRFASAELEGMEKSATNNSFIKVLGGGAALAIALALGSAYMSREYLNAKNPKLKHLDFYNEGLTAPEKLSPRLEFVIENDENKIVTDKSYEDLKADKISDNILTEDNN